MKKTLPIAAIYVLTTLQLLSYIAMVTAFFYFADNIPADDSLREFREGFLTRAGYDPQTFAGADARYLMGYYGFDATFPFLALIGITFKVRWLLCTASVLSLIIAFVGGGLPIIQLIVVICVFSKSTTEYLNNEEQDTSVDEQENITSPPGV